MTLALNRRRNRFKAASIRLVRTERSSYRPQSMPPALSLRRKRQPL